MQGADERRKPDQCQPADDQAVNMVVMKLGQGLGPVATVTMAEAMAAGMPFGPHMLAETAPCLAAIPAMATARLFAFRRIALGLFADRELFPDADSNLSHLILHC
jgi:hypothetical protein